jgi:hypothetical protein
MYASTKIIRVIILRRMRQVRHVVCIGGMRNACNILVGKSEGKRPLGSPWHKWEYNNIRKDPRETGLEGMD